MARARPRQESKAAVRGEGAQKALAPSPQRLAQLLRRQYGLPTRREPQGLIASVVRTILSQNTTGRNADAAYEELRAKFPDWHAVASARLRSLASSLRRSGLANKRARVIREVVRRLLEEGSEARVEQRLRAMSTEEVLEFLQSFDGIGPKTAACVALFELGRDVFPVDTHILRISNRLGWVRPEASAEEAQRLLEPLIPPSLRFQLHVNLINHGRRVCRPNKPECPTCVLCPLCAAARGGTIGK
ncbi:MAG: endonuclease III [Armatimonadetes bacterium]|nr:endonuclease III [Armatimonadota bacterium]